MSFRAVLSQLNVIGQCRKYRLPLWQCPQFIFLIMGIVIIGSIILTYLISTKFIANPLIVSFIVVAQTLLLLILDFIIIQSFEKLAQAAKMRSDFIGIVTHQLRAPLTNLKWTIESLMALSLKEGQVEYVRLLKENSERMTELLSDLLIVSRIEEGNLPVKNESFSLVELVEKITKEFKPFAQAHNVKIYLTARRNLPLVWADPYQIKQVLENLIDNAIKYTKEKEDIKITLSQQDKEILCQIKDRGMGILQQEQKYVFKKFFRANDAKLHQPQGSGLGLFIAKSIVEKNGGQIGFKSEENKGSTFWFTLPIK